MDATRIKAREIYQNAKELKYQDNALKWQSREDSNSLVFNTVENAGPVMPLVCMARDQILSAKCHVEEIRAVNAELDGETVSIKCLLLIHQTRKLRTKRY